MLCKTDYDAALPRRRWCRVQTNSPRVKKQNHLPEESYWSQQADCQSERMMEASVQFPSRLCCCSTELTTLLLTAQASSTSPLFHYICYFLLTHIPISSESDKIIHAFRCEYLSSLSMELNGSYALVACFNMPPLVLMFPYYISDILSVYELSRCLKSPILPAGM